MNNGKKSHPYASGPLSTEHNDLIQDAVDYGSYPHLFQLSSLWTTSTEKISRQDFLSKLLDITKKTVSKTTDEKPCKNVLAVDDLLTLLKKKLKDDFAYDMSTTKMTPEDRFGDIQVEDFISKLYKDKFTSPTQRVSEMEHLNSTLLVNLVEAVIFRNTGDKHFYTGTAQNSVLLFLLILFTLNRNIYYKIANFFRKIYSIRICFNNRGCYSIYRCCENKTNTS